MAKTLSTNIRRLQNALNDKGQHILYFTSQFYSVDQNRPVTKHTLKQAIEQEGTKRCDTITLFNSYSQVQVLLYLRDMWYKVNGWEIPNDNPVWEKIKEEQGLFRDEGGDDICKPQNTKSGNS